MTEATTEHNSLVDRVEKALENIRPYLVSDGGDVRLLQITEDLNVELQLMGNCETCNMSNMTMKAGIEEAIRRVAPEVKTVTAVNL
jgi:Fe-S cluster biogenesis protein NfuA